MFVTWQKKIKLCKVSDGTRVVVKVLGILDTLLWARLSKRMEKHTPKPCATFSTERIVALWSVNKIFLESYDFAATNFMAQKLAKYFVIRQFWVRVASHHRLPLCYL
jgi:hypothetical protein